MSRYIIAATFEEQSELYRLVNNTRFRMGASNKHDELVYLPLIAPFTLKHLQGGKELFEDLDDTLKSFFHDDYNQSISFNAVEVYKSKKRFLLYLDPKFSINFEYFLDSLKSIEENHFSSLKMKTSKKPYLVLGKFFNEFQAVSERSNIKSHLNLSENKLKIKDISLFQYFENGWRVERELINFKNESNGLILKSNEQTFNYNSSY